MSLFEKRFFSLLEQDEVEAPEAPTDSQAMETQLDKGTDPKALDVQAPPQVDQARASHNAAQKKILATWIEEVGKFIEYLNGTTGNSVQSQLASSSCDTLFEKIANSEKKRIARVAMELSSLNESLKGYLISNEQS